MEHIIYFSVTFLIVYMIYYFASIRKAKKNKKKLLLSEINGLEEDLKWLLNKINAKENSLKEYNSMFSDIDILRKHQMSLGNNEEKIRKTCNYFYSKPELAFDTVDEYNVYLKCMDENSKKEIIDYKVLTKQKR